MPGLTASLAGEARSRALVGAIAALAAFLLLGAIGAAPPAHAAGCDTFTNTAGGSWSEAANWSAKHAPTSEEDACITEPGTYTVTYSGLSSTVKSLTVGASSGAQTLQVGSTCSVNAALAATNGTTIGADGILTMTNADGCGDSATLEGTVVNNGAIVTEPAHGGNRTLAGSLTNNGTVTANATTLFDGSKTALVNQGKIAIAEGKGFDVSNKASVANDTGGKIEAASGAAMSLGSETSFTEGAGTTSGTLPVIVDDGALAYEASGGESTIAIRGTSTLSGSSSAKQTLQVQSTCGENAALTAASGFTNGGALVLTNGDGCGDSVTVTGALTNAGTIASEAAHGGNRTLSGNLVNTGTVAINRETTWEGSGATLTNKGAIDIAEGARLNVTKSNAVDNTTGGTITAGATGVMSVGSGASFTQGAGTTSGTLPVIVDDGALTYEAAGGESTIAVRGTSTVGGTTAAKQSLLVQSTCGEHALATITPSLVNGGAIVLTNGDGCGNNATLSGTVTNSGSITTEHKNGGRRALIGNVTNTGTITIGSETFYEGTSDTLVNKGTISIAEGETFSVAKTNAVENAAGTIAAASGGVMSLGSGTTFTQGAGTTSGTVPVVLDDGALVYTGTGESTIGIRGTSTLTGGLGAKQTLIVQSTCGEHASLSVAASLTNAGHVTLTNGDGCGNNETISIAEGATLTNSGTLTTEVDHGGARTLVGAITNAPGGTIDVTANTAYTNSGFAATLRNEGTLEVATGIALTVTGKTTIADEAGAIVGVGTGALSQTGGAFDQGAGKETGTQPVVIDDGALTYTGKGTGTIALRGTSTLTGTINTGQKLSIQSTCSEHASVSAAGFTNSGTIVLTNGDGCGNNETLKLGGGTLEDKGTVAVEEAHGGSRTIEGSLTNEKSVTVAAGATLVVTGAYTQGKKGGLTINVASASSFGKLSVSGAATIGGKLTVKAAKGFAASLGQSYAVLGSAALTGTFAKMTGAGIKGKGVPAGLYYRPTYSATTVTLVVTQEAIALSASSGAPGAKVTITGTGFTAGDTVKLSFQDAKKVTTAFANATVSAGGEISEEVEIPATAAEGTGTFTATSVLTGVKATGAFKVT